jgi:hypothetical protein
MSLNCIVTESLHFPGSVNHEEEKEEEMLIDGGRDKLGKRGNELPPN